MPRGLQELNVQLSKLVEQLTVQYARSPTIAELAEAADVEEEDVLEALESGRAYSSLSLSTGGGTEDGEELDPLESLGEIEREYEVSEDRAVLAPGFKVLDERERAILHLRFFEGLTQSQIAQQVGHLADARVAADPPRAREDQGRDRRRRVRSRARRLIATDGRSVIDGVTGRVCTKQCGRRDRGQGRWALAPGAAGAAPCAGPRGGVEFPIDRSRLGAGRPYTVRPWR